MVYLLFGQARDTGEPIAAVATEAEWHLLRHGGVGLGWRCVSRLPGDAAEAARLRGELGCDPGSLVSPVRGGGEIAWQTWCRLKGVYHDDCDRFGLPRRLRHRQGTGPVPVAKGLGSRLARRRRGDAALPRE